MRAQAATVVGVGIVLAAAIGAPAVRADRPLCSPGSRYRGAVVDLDVKGADVRDVFHLLADVGKVGLVVADDVRGRVTLRLRRVPWDQVACTVAAMHRLSITTSGTILVVTPAARGSRAQR